MKFSKVSLMAVAVAVGAGAAGAGAANADGPLPSMNAPELAQGPYSSMRMRLQKTVLNINVADIDVRFDKATQAKMAELARGKPYTEGLAHQLSLATLDAKNAMFQMTFLRSVPLNRWIGVVKDSLDEARAASLITAAMQKTVMDGLPQWFGALKDRGYEKGDRLMYAINPEGVRSVVASAGGQVFVDRTDKGHDGRRVVISSYFAPKSEFREPLLRSLVEQK
jgi:hypothetical protein